MSQDDEAHLEGMALEMYKQFQTWGCYARSLQPTIEAKENELHLLDVMEGLRKRWVTAEELVKQRDEELRRLTRDFEQLKVYCASVEDNLKKARAEAAYHESEKQTMQVELDSLNRKVDLGRNLLSSLNVDENTKPSVASSRRRSRSSKLNSSRLNDASIDFDVTGDSLEDDLVPELPKTKYTMTKRSRGQAVVHEEVDENETPNKRSRAPKSILISKESPMKSGIRRSMNRSFSESNLLDVQNEEKREALAEINRHSAKTSSTQDVRQKQIGSLGLGPSWTSGFPIEERAHRFVKHSQAMPDYCDVCNQRIFFTGKPALKCTDCPLRIHRDCKIRAPTPCIPRGCGTPKTPRKTRPKLKDFCPSSRPMIPSVMIKCVGALESSRMNYEGIYRIPGQETHVVKLLEHLKSSRPFPKMDLADTETITGCLKKFLKDLSDSLIPMTSWREFSKAVECNSESMLNNAVLELPVTNRDTLAYFCCHLQRVAESSQINKMPLENLARCLGPTVVGVSHVARLKTQAQASEEANMQIAIMRKLLEMPSAYWKSFIEGPGMSISSPPHSGARRQILPLESPRTPIIETSMLGPIHTPPSGMGHVLPLPVARRGPLFDRPY